MIVVPTERPTTEPSERKRYETAVATAWSSGPAFAMSATSVLVIPAPIPRLFATMPESGQQTLVSARRAETGAIGDTHR